LIFNILPSFWLTIPMAFLLAVLLGLGRLASESELIAMQAVGVSPLFLLRALMLLGLAASGATYYVHAFWVPDANQEYRETAFALAISRAQGVKPRVFIEDLLPNRSLYLTDVEVGTGAWKDALIIDRQDPDSRGCGWPGAANSINRDQPSRTSEKASDRKTAPSASPKASSPSTSARSSPTCRSPEATAR
jgi:lipopolysaccharide export LptBFGC system permease protein LptF